MAEEQQKREDENNEIKEMGTLNMKESGSKYGIQLLTIIGEIEGHDSVSGNTKATKYEHLLPRLAQIEEDDETDGVLILLNTLGGLSLIHIWYQTVLKDAQLSVHRFR